MDLAMHAEVLAFREGLLVVAALRWASSHYFVFELNCSVGCCLCC